MKGRLVINNSMMVKVLFVLLFINYFVVTILFHNFFLFQYLRDAILVYLLVVSISNGKVYAEKVSLVCIAIFSCMLISGFLEASSLKAALQETRRYLFPLVLLFILKNNITKKKMKSWIGFLLHLLTVIAAWGVFQAMILGDQFLINLGYPTRYAYEYGRIALNYSYYFGNLGIQRVSSTFSSSNICAAIFGVTLIFCLVNFEELKEIKFFKICLLIISLGYLLTFSRSNFLAMAVIGILFIWPYIPYKRYILIALAFICVAGALYLLLFDNTILSSIWNWVEDSVHFKDSSSAGRGAIWKKAGEAVINNPMGIGLGHTGENAFQIKTDVSYACENSYLCMALDAGILGMTAYVIFTIHNIYSVKKRAATSKKQGNLHDFKLYFSVYAILIYFMIICFFSNHIIDMELVSYVFLFVAIGTTSMERENKG